MYAPVHANSPLAALSAQACKEATCGFARISTSVKAVEEELNGGGGDGVGLAKWVRKLQEAEKGKLQLTIGLQVRFPSMLLCFAQSVTRYTRTNTRTLVAGGTEAARRRP